MDSTVVIIYEVKLERQVKRYELKITSPKMMSIS